MQRATLRRAGTKNKLGGGQRNRCRRRRDRETEGVEAEAPKAPRSKRRRRRGGEVWGGSFHLSIRLGALGERDELPSGVWGGASAQNEFAAF